MHKITITKKNNRIYNSAIYIVVYFVFSLSVKENSKIKNKLFILTKTNLKKNH